MLENYRGAVEARAAQLLTDYTVRIAARHARRYADPKEINDPVWGTLTLDALEVLLLDSPVFQRLRRIRQLGVAHWVYPAATHTRLEHSIGTVSLAQRLLAATQSDAVRVPDEFVRAIRIAALCHDVGHCVMSHVAENALKYVDVVEKLRLDFAKEYGRELQLGEMNSYFIVGSPAFVDLLRVAETASKTPIGVSQPTVFIQQCILGQAVDPKFPLLHQLVSGPFDADKLDYMTRDTYMSGVPVVTDVNRLIRKVRGIERQRTEVPVTVQKLSNIDTPIVFITGIDRSGNRTVDELTLGRTLLFDKLYRHHKTRACEAMVAAMLVKVANDAVAGDHPWEAALTALRLDDELLATAAISSAAPDLALHDETIEFVEHMARWLRERRLFVRAIAFSRKMTGDSYDEDDEQGRGLQELLAAVTEAWERRAVADAIADATASALEILGQSDVVAGWPGSLRDYIWVDGVRTPEHLTASTKAMLITPEDEVVPFSAEAPETPQWATAYQQTRDTAFVFCPPEIALPTALAAERFVRDAYGVHLPRTALVATRTSPNKGRDERKALAAGQFYTNSAYDLLPLPDRLWEGDADGLLERIAKRLHGYCPPLVEPNRAGRDGFDARRVRDFVQQFHDDSLIDTALTMFGALEMIDRNAVVRPLRQLLEEHEEFQRGSLVVFGSAADSSSIATYFALDAGATYPGLRVREIGDALIHGEPIIFVDDIIGSGRQAAAIVRAWFGDTALADELGEMRSALPTEVHRLLQGRQLAFCFAASLSGGPEELQTALHSSEITDVVVHVGRDEASLPTISTVGDVNDTEREAFVSRCREIGEALLVDQPADKRANRGLGYGNKGLLLTFPYNTPSQTLTCLWERGTVEGKPWTPLLPRRRKR